MTFSAPKTEQHLHDLTHFLRDVPVFWAVAGGWAIDLFIGRQTREHGDIDLVIWREDQQRFRRALPPGKWRYIKNGWSQDWDENHVLHLPVHELYYENDNNPSFEVLLEEKNQTHFIYRRDDRIRHLLQHALLESGNVKFLAPELALLHKSKKPSVKDNADFDLCISHLPQARKVWLREALTTLESGHPWLGRL